MKVLGPASYRYLAVVMTILALIWGRSLFMLGSDAPGAYKFFNLLLVLALVVLAVLAWLPVTTEILPGRAIQRSFGYRVREVENREIEQVLAHDEALYLLLRSGERMLLARGVNGAPMVAERMSEALGLE